MMRFVTAFTSLALVPATALAQVAPAAPRDGGSAGQCTAREVSSSRLLIEGGRETFLEPVVVVPAGDRVLLAGKPSYVFRNRKSGASADLESIDSLFGAVIEPSGAVRGVPTPPVNAPNLTAVAATSDGLSRWRVIFAETDSTPAAQVRVVMRYWHGTYDGARWLDIEPLPRPGGVSLEYFNSSRLIQRGDTLFWAGIVRSGATSQGVVVFERVRGVWTSSTPKTPYASSVEVVHTPEKGFMLGVFRRSGGGILLPGAIQEEEPKNALHLFARDPAWELQQQVPLPRNPAISSQRLDALGDLLSISTLARGPTPEQRLQLRAIVDTASDVNSAGFIVDPNATPHFAPVVLGNADVMWVSQHVAVPGDSTDQGELQLIRRTADEAKVLWRAPNPFLGPFNATASSASDIIIVGPELDRAHELLVSRIIRVRVDCVPVPTGP